ncbi:MAG: hydroxyacid dehydrogenase [Clostridia bacterium]|nr:hydroxyacid dehydrogenase [Clostridia bacterium]
MKTLYLCETPQNIKNVYATDEAVYCKADVLSHPEQFECVEIIFSTWGMPQFSEEEIKRYLPNLKAVFYGAGSVQSFAKEFLNCGVKVFSAWAANAVPVAEYTVAQIVLANKGFFKTQRFTNMGESLKVYHQYPGNYNVKVGIIGAGMIGKLVINMLKSYNVQVLVFDPFLPDGKAEELGVTKVSLEEIFAQCQVVSNHLANNEQTKGMLNKALFQKMLPYATFLNTGRGAQVVESDLIEVLKQREDLTAVLDVTFPEPPQADSEFYTLDNCILTPHIAGSSGNEVQRMGEYMNQEYENLIKNKPCKYEVTLDMLKTMA